MEELARSSRLAGAALGGLGSPRGMTPRPISDQPQGGRAGERAGPRFKSEGGSWKGRKQLLE